MVTLRDVAMYRRWDTSAGPWLLSVAMTFEITPQAGARMTRWRS
jgi:hypothetical protein